MANPEHLKILNQAVEVWNKWRLEYPSINPELDDADLSECAPADAWAYVNLMGGQSISVVAV